MILSCKNKTSLSNFEPIKGTWKISPENYIIKSDSIIGLTRGSFLFALFSLDRNNKMCYPYYSIDSNCRSLFNQTESKYLLKDDTLSLFSQRNSSWYDFKIIALDNHTMVIKNDYNNLFNGLDTVKFDKAKEEKSTFDFDAIIIKSEIYRLYSQCKKNTIYFLNKNGYFQIVDLESTYKSSSIAYNISENLVDSIFKNFDQVNFNKLSNTYLSGLSSEDITNFEVYFLKNNLVVKKVTDHHISSPAEFYTSYLPIINMQQKGAKLNITQSNIDSLINSYCH